MIRTLRVRSRSVILLLCAAGLLSGGAMVWAIVTDYALVETLHPDKAEHLDQSALVALVRAHHAGDALDMAFEHGDELFETEFRSIDGVVEGTIEVGQHSLMVGVGASIKADLVGRVVTIGGSITGNVTATEKVDLKATGSVEGDIKTPRFAMAEGAVVRGHVQTGNKPSGRS